MWPGGSRIGRAAANPTDVCDPARAGHRRRAHARPAARRPLPPPHRAAGRRRAARRRGGAVGRLGLDPRAHVGLRRALPRPRARARRPLPAAARHAAPRGGRRGDLPERDRLPRPAGRAAGAAARRRGRRPGRRGARLRRGHHGRPRAARLPPDGLPDRRPRPGGDGVRRRLAARRRRGHGGRHRPRRGHRRLRLHHDRLPDAVHDPRGPDLGGARAGPDAARVAPALAQRRPPDRTSRVRDRQPPALAIAGVA